MRLSLYNSLTCFLTIGGFGSTAGSCNLLASFTRSKWDSKRGAPKLNLHASLGAAKQTGQVHFSGLQITLTCNSYPLRSQKAELV